MKSKRIVVWLVFVAAFAFLWSSYSHSMSCPVLNVQGTDRSEWIIMGVEPRLVRVHAAWSVNWLWLIVGVATTAVLVITTRFFDRRITGVEAA